MLQYLDFTLRSAPNVFCSAFEEIIANGEVRQFDGGFAFSHPADKKLLDYTLVNAISEALLSSPVSATHTVSERQISL